MRTANTITLPEQEIKERFVRASGDRGQNAARDATAVELRLDIAKSSLPREVQGRLIGLAGRHVTKAGVLMIVSRASASQTKNRETARARLLKLLTRAWASPPIRRPTRFPVRAKADLLNAKRQHGATKRARKQPRND